MFAGIHAVHGAVRVLHCVLLDAAPATARIGRMKFSLYYLPTYDPEHHGSERGMFEQIFEQVDVAERAGMDSAWFSEHHFTDYGGHVPSVPVLLAAVSQRTERLKVGSAGICLPLHNPVEIAEQLGMVDVLSGGRLRVGVVHAFLHYEFGHLNIPMDESRERMREAVDVLHGVWRSEAFSYQGRFNTLDGVRVLPRPVQRPHPRLMFGTILTRESFEYAGRNGLDLMVIPYLSDAAGNAEKIGWYTGSLRDTGRDPAAHEVMAPCFLYCAPTDARAKEEGRAGMLGYLGYLREAVAQDRWGAGYTHYSGMVGKLDQMIGAYDLLFDERTLFGSPGRIIARIRELEAIGVTEIALKIDQPRMPRAQIMASLDLFVREVLPAFAGR